MAALLEKLFSLYRGIPGPLLARLLTAPFLLSLIDFSVTLCFQPSAYWEGDRSAVVESNPIARWCFLIHPLMILPGMIAWYLLIIPVILRTPSWIGLRIHVFLVFSHLIATSGWLIRKHEAGFLFTIILWVLALPLAWVLVKPKLSYWNSRAPMAS
jgi:hypothetical protein